MPSPLPTLRENRFIPLPHKLLFRLSALLGLFVFLVSALWPLLAPGLRLFLAGVNPQRPDHSFFLADGPMPLEARMLGIFGGFAVGLACLVGFKDRLPAERPTKLLWALSAAGIGTAGFDGVNAFLWDMGVMSFYPPTNGLRLLTGTVAGAGVALLLVPYAVLLDSGDSRTRVRWEMLLGCLLLAEGCFLSATISGLDVLARLSLLFGVLGVVVLFWASNGIVLSLLAGRSSRSLNLGGRAVVALGLALGELLLLAFLRHWLQNRLEIVLA